MAEGKKENPVYKYLTLVNDIQAEVFRRKYTDICNWHKKHKRQITGWIQQGRDEQTYGNTSIVKC